MQISKRFSPISTPQITDYQSPRTPTFSDAGLQDLMNVQNFTTASAGTSSSNSSTPSSTGSGSGSGSDSSSKSSHTGAIAGGVVGGILGLALLAGLAFFFVRRSRKAKQAPPSAAQEMPGDAHEKYEMSATPDVPYGTTPGHGMYKDGKYAGVDAQPSPHYELPGSDGTRHELA
jgi:LPXTG-motif cell wall-anchored protein